MIDPEDSKERFSSRVDDYVRYRPGYPAALTAMLFAEAGLGADARVVDVGAGTGIMTRLWLDSLGPLGRVIAIEPNRAMRAAAERSSRADGRFESVDGSAEHTGQADASADLVVAAQAFHWFDAARTRVEFARILKPGGLVALVWNQRRDNPLNVEYEDMLERLAPAYALVREKDRATEGKLRAFFAPSIPRRAVFDNEQRFDEVGLKGRLLSSSYCPPVGDPGHAPIMQRLVEIFRAHEEDGAVTLAYDTVVWYAKFG